MVLVFAIRTHVFGLEPDELLWFGEILFPDFSYTVERSSESEAPMMANLLPFVRVENWEVLPDLEGA